MKKKLKVVAVVVALIGIVAFIAYYAYTNSFVPSADVAKKVVFEGLKANVAAGESYNSVAEKVKAIDGNSNPKLIITVQSVEYGLDNTSPDDDMTLQEVQEWLREHRRLMKEQQQENSGNIAGELELDYMNITYEYDSYAPNIYAEFKGPLTKGDIVDIYRIAKNPKVLNVTVKLEK